MGLTEYKQSYLNFRVAVEQTRLISLAAGDALKDFPRRLPKDTQKTILAVYEDMQSTLTKAVRSMRKKSRKAQTPKTYKVDLINPLAESAVRSMLSRFFAGAKDTDFDRLLYAQELVMIIAHLDGFLADSVRAICKTESRVLHSNKQMTWDSILKCGNWDNLVEKMIEEHSYSFGWKTICERVQYLTIEYRLTIKTTAAILHRIEEAEKIRHAVIHNSGRVSQEYLNRTGRTDVKIGDIIPITSSYTGELNNMVQVLASDVFRAIAEKFLQAKEDLSGVLWTHVEKV